MPTTRYRHVRMLLNEHKAVVVSSDMGFTIRLKYDTPDVVQPLFMGIDPGRTNIGAAVAEVDSTPVVTVHVTTRNKDIPDLMKKRKANRNKHRNYGRRKVRRRRAKRNKTIKAACFERRLPGCTHPIVLHDIRNKEARFNNRKRPEGWLTPTARQLLQTHINMVKKIMKVLPISDVVMEINKFDFQALDNPKIKRWEYGNGPLKGYGSVENAVYALQDGKCLLCGRCIEHYHHIVPRHLHGSNTYSNIAGLCSLCHKAVHTSETAKNELADRKMGLNQKYGALGVLNQIMPYLWNELAAMFPEHVYATDGDSTAKIRKAGNLPKDHYIDAYCIAVSPLQSIADASVIPEPVEIQQFRRHDRQVCNIENLNRVYCLNGRPIAVNRHKATEQTKNSLAEVRETLSEKELFSLTVKPHKPQYKNPKRHMPGSIYLFNGCRYVLKGNDGFHKGQPDYCVSSDGQKHPYKKCIFVNKNAGLVVL